MLLMLATMAVKAEMMSRPENDMTQSQRDDADQGTKPKDQGGEEDTLRHDLTTDANVIDGCRVHGAHQFAVELFAEQQRADHLDTTAGRAGTGRETAQEKHPERLRTSAIARVDTGTAGRRGNRDDVEQRMAQGCRLIG